jgi:hypothetical protein
MSGTIGAIPAASLAGRLYYATDEGLLYRDTGAAWVQVADRGGKWSPHRPPVPIHTMGDEFDDSSLDAKWTEWDPAGALLTPSEDQKGLKLVHTDNPSSTENYAGIYQALGADDEYEFITRASFSVGAATGVQPMVGILLLQDPDVNPTTCDLIALVVRGTNGVPSLVAAYRMTSYTVFSSSTHGQATQTIGSAYLCLQWKASTGKYCAYYSNDGTSWIKIVNDVAHGMAAAPGFVGLGVNAFSADVTGRFEFFRVRSAASGIYNVFPEPLGG